MRSRFVSLGWIGLALALSPASALADAPPPATPPAPPKIATVDTTTDKPDASKKPDKKKPDPGDAIDIAPEVLAMTGDPVVGNAARVEGTEAPGMVAFTFDDGPNPATTPAVIDALQKYDIPATFFIITQRITGKSADKAREALAREVAGGFVIGSHSVTHPNLKRYSQAQLKKEIDASIATLSPQIGRPVGIFRAPYGALGPAGRARLKKLGVTETFWSIDTVDWGLKGASAGNIALLRKRTLAMILRQNGGVVLMHDRTQVTAKTAALIFDDLEAENCKRLAAATAATAAAAAPPPPPPAPTDPKAAPKKPPPKVLDPIIPVSIHYFLRDGKTPRPVPTEVDARTAAYKLALPGRCAARQVVTPPATSTVDNHIKPH